MPLRLRLALWYGGLTGLVVLLVSLFTYAAHSRSQYDNLDYGLSSAVQHIVEEHAKDQAVGQLADALSVPVAPDLAMRVYGSGGELLASSPNAAPAPAVDPRLVLAEPIRRPFDPVIGLGPPFIQVDEAGGTFGVARDREGRRWRVYVDPVAGGTRDFVGLSPLGPVDESVAKLGQYMLLFTLLGAALTFAGGWLLAGRALRPVAALDATASAIARSRDFRRRVQVGEAKDELGRLAATFNEMLGSLEEAYRAQQRFVADASHELRAPLTSIRANLELLDRRGNMSDEERRVALGEVRHEAERLATLVGDLLVLARADARVPLRRQRVELDRVLLDAFGQAQHLAHGQELDVAEFEPALVEGDPDQLKQLFLILLDNAVRYTPSGGKISVSLRPRNSFAEVAIRDSGVGIPSEALPHVFERFFRADPARARDPGGTGLGLSIAQWIAEQHGGEISLASEVGRGTTATIRLPLLR